MAKKKKGMNGAEIMAAIRNLAYSQGRYGRMLAAIEAASEEQRDEWLAGMEAHEFSGPVDLVMHLEGC